MLNYNGYIGVAEYDDEAETFHGEIANTRDVITFQSSDAKALKSEMIKSIDAHIAFCAKIGREASKPYSGEFLVRTSPQMHGIFTAAAKQSKMSNYSCIVAKVDSVIAIPVSGYWYLISDEEKADKGLFDNSYNLGFLVLKVGYVSYRDWKKKFGDTGYFTLPRITLRLRSQD
jgi:predicted HicB family RNase H-like nuclease